MRAFAAGILAALAAFAIASSSALADAPRSGLEGKVMRGPTQPVCVVYRM